MEGQGLRAWWFSPGARRSWQHLLDFDRDTVAIDKDATAQAHYLMNGHRSGTEDHHEIDGDFIEGWHW